MSEQEREMVVCSKREGARCCKRWMNSLFGLFCVVDMRILARQMFWECWLNHRTMSLTEHKNWVRRGQKYSAVAVWGGIPFVFHGENLASHSIPIDSEDSDRTKYKDVITW